MPAIELPINRLFHQVIRDSHLTFNKKCRDLVMQIYGHEGLVDEADTADIAHCSFFNIDFYRMSLIKSEHLALRKLANPFKLVEFLIVATLELPIWCFTRLAVRIGKNLDSIKEKKLLWYFSWFCIGGLFLIYYPPHLAVNLITGVLRRFLAPVRYLIRPAIETARKYPQSFLAIVVVTLGIAIGLTVAILTGGLPAIVGGLFPAGTVTLKLATVGISSVSLGAFLTKGFNTVRELIGGCLVAFPEERDIEKQDDDLFKRNQKTNYLVNIIKIKLGYRESKLFIEENIPLIVWRSDNNVFVYGRSRKGEPNYGQLYRPGEEIPPSLEEYCQELEEETVCKEKQLCAEVYWHIHFEKCHFPLKKGSTAKITEALHAIDIDHTEVRAPKDQDYRYSAALFFGLESVFYPKKKQPDVTQDKLSMTMTSSLLISQNLLSEEGVVKIPLAHLRR